LETWNNVSKLVCLRILKGVAQRPGKKSLWRIFDVAAPVNASVSLHVRSVADYRLENFGGQRCKREYAEAKGSGRRELRMKKGNPLWDK
jgi:hypothetical protein